MTLGLNRWLILAFLAVFMGAPLLAQSFQFVPETDTHLTLNSYLRTYVQPEGDRDAGASDQFSIGPSLQLYL